MSTHHDHDALEQDLRKLRFEGPSPHLRTRTLRAARQAMEDSNSLDAPWGDWWKDVALAAAVLVCVVVLPWLRSPDLSTTNTRAPQIVEVQPVDAREVASLLDLDDELAEYTASRLNQAQRTTTRNTTSRGMTSHDRYTNTFQYDPSRL